MNRSLGYWDHRFLRLAQDISTDSKDPSTQAGAVIVDRNRHIVSTGYNGFPRKMPDLDELYANRTEKYSRIIHCEINAAIAAARDLDGHTLYTYPFACCDRCVVQMIQYGIIRFVYPKPSADALTRWGDAFQLTEKYMRECNVDYLEVTL